MSGPSMLEGWQAAVSRLFEPSQEDRGFLIDGATIGDIRSLAASLRYWLGNCQDRPVCLATEDKALLAAALLARLAGGPPLLLPYALSDQALLALHQATGCCRVVAGKARDLPRPLELIVPASALSGVMHLEQTVFDEEALLLSLYTGGSTGTPQIWPKTVRNIFGEAFLLARLFDVAPRDCVLATIVPYHIYGLLYAVCLPLLTGARVLAATPSFPEEILQVAFAHRATIFISVPAHYKALHGKGVLSPCLRLAFSSAGMLDPEDNAAFSRQNPAGIVEVYGSTETGGIALRNRSQGEEGMTPYPTMDWQIKNERLLLRSPFLSPGVQRDSGGYFLAGDRVAPCGAAQFVLQGRADAIIKVGGKRVDLDEVRLLITSMPGISDCLVLALADSGSREHRIVALVETATVPIENIRAMLAVRLEPYALPRAIKTIAQLPMKANGKPDRAAILQLFAS